MAFSFIQLPTDGTGKRTQTILEGTDHIQVVTDRRVPTFFAFAFDIAPVVNAYMLAILNRTSPVKVIRIWQANVHIGSEVGVLGILAKLRLLRITSTVALSGGVAVTAGQMDTADAVPANIDIQTKPTNALTNSAEFNRFLLSTEEALVTTLNANSEASQNYPRFPLMIPLLPPLKPITIRNNSPTFEGFAVQNLVGAAGNVALQLIFTVTDE